MIRNLYNRAIALAERPDADRWLAVVSFAESSFFPVPPDAMLLPMALARPDRAWYYAAVCTIASVLGGIFGYFIGYFFIDSVGRWIIEVYGLKGGLEQFRHQFEEWGLYVILIKGLTPIPYKLVTIASGIAQFSLPVFIIASIITRGGRFFLLAGLLHFYGQPIRDFIERRLMLVTSVFAAIIIVGIIALKFI